MFCPKCGSILLPKSDGKKKMTYCSCGYKKECEDFTLKESVKEKKQIEVVDSSKDLDSLPQIDAECPKCSNKKAYFWTIQTRASDEPETKFLKCTKCKHTWRDYS